MKKNKSRILIAPAAIFYFCFILFPLLFFFAPLLQGGRAIWVLAAKEFFSGSMPRILGFTFFQAVLSALLCVMVGFFGAWLFGRYDFPFKNFMNTLFMIPFISPPVIVVTGIVLFFGNNGILNQALRVLFPSFSGINILYSFPAVIIAHAMYNFPIAIRIIGAGVKGIGENPSLAARIMGSSRSQVFFRIVLPRLLPSILSSFMIIFLYCFSSFVFVLVLGGGIRFTTLEVETYRLIRTDPSSLQALLFALISLSTTLLSLTVLIHLQSRASRAEEKTESRPLALSKTHPLMKTFAIVYLIFILFVLLSPFVSLAISSLTVFAPGRIASFSFANYLSLFKNSGYIVTGFAQAFLNSFSFAWVSAFVSLALGIPAAAYLAKKKSTVTEMIFQIPMAVSTLIFSYAFILVSVFTGIGLFRLRFGIQIIHIAMCLPFCIRALLPVFSSLSWSPFHAARTLGAGKIRAFFTGIGPQIRPALPGAFIFSMILSLGELTAVLLLGEGQIVTVPLYIYRLIGAYHFPAAGAASIIYLIVCLGSFYFSEKFFTPVKPEYPIKGIL